MQASGNYATLATSATYARQADAKHAIELIKGGVGSGEIVVDAGE